MLDGFQPRVAINTSSLALPLSGIGRYVSELIGALEAGGWARVKCFGGLRWRKPAPPREDSVGRGARSFFRDRVPFSYEIRRAAQQLAFSGGTAWRGLDVYHEPAFLAFDCDLPTVVTVHDLAWIRYPELHPKNRVRYLERKLPRSLERAAHVITGSEFVRQEVIATFALHPDTVTAISYGVSARLTPRSPERCRPTLARFDLRWRSFVLCVGTSEPRKNLDLALRAYEALPANLRDRVPLVHAGGAGWLNAELAARFSRGQGHLRKLGFVSEADLANLYASAAMLVYPSRYEGFGLPPLEAMASGTPVIAAKAASLPEVVGNAAVFVSPDDDLRLKEEMERLLRDESHWANYRELGLARARLFTWDNCARQTCAIYCAACPVARNPS